MQYQSSQMPFLDEIYEGCNKLGKSLDELPVVGVDTHKPPKLRHILRLWLILDGPDLLLVDPHSVHHYDVSQV